MRKGHFEEAFFTMKFLYTKLFPNDVTNKEDQGAIIEKSHSRAHRNYRENVAQFRQQCCWPLMIKQFKQYVRNCNCCKYVIIINSKDTRN